MLQQSLIPKSHIGRKSRFLPQLEGPRWNIAMTFGTEKLPWRGYPMVKKFDDMLTRFDRMPNGQTDGHRTTA